MSNTFNVFGRLNSAEKSHCVRTMVKVIMLERKLSEFGLGKQLNPPVSQTTVSRWANGDIPSDSHFRQLERLFFGPWHYLCSFSDHYASSLALEAREALFRVRAITPVTMKAALAAQLGIEIDLHIRPAKLVEGAWAHTFANRPSLASVFVILVRDDLLYHEQYRIAWEEVLAHVIRPQTKSDEGLPIAVSLRQHFADSADKPQVTVLLGKLRGPTEDDYWMIETKKDLYLILLSQGQEIPEWFVDGLTVKASGEIKGQVDRCGVKAALFELRALEPVDD